MAIVEAERARRAIGFMLVALIACGVLTARLAHLQLFEGEKFLKKAEGNRLRIIPYRAPRGLILDRHGRQLASNRLSYSLVLYPHKMQREKIEEVLALLRRYLSFDAAGVRAKVEKLGYSSPHAVKVKGNLDQRTIARILENEGELPGASIEPEIIRHYPQGKLAAHVVGYTGEVTDAELGAESGAGLNQGDILGKTGMERIYDASLRGENGSQQVEVDARGRLVKVLRQIPPTPGKDLKLFIDAKLQAAAEKALDDAKLTGAIVAMDPRTGEVLALASRPTFDPNVFARQVRPDEWRALQRMNYPFVNRALSAYPPGSIYKIPMAMAALETGATTPGRLFHSTGSMRVGNRIFHDWHAPGFGYVDIVKSLQWSVDTVYYELGVKMGGDTMARYAHAFGLGEPTGIGLGRETAGLIPDPEWKKRVWKDKWWPGDSANVSIGQGAVSVTPIQAAVMISTIANGGKVLVPRLVNDGGTPPPPRKVNHFKPQNMATVRKGLRLVVSSGTGTVADVPGKQISGKTGSAESGHRLTHGWFVAYGPEPAPTIALVAFAEKAGHGGSMAAPLARAVLNEYFGIKPPKASPKPGHATD